MRYTISRYRAHARRRSVVSLRLAADQSSSRLPSVTGPQQFATYSTFRSLGYNLLSLTSVTSHSIPYPEPRRVRLSLPLFRRSEEMHKDALNAVKCFFYRELHHSGTREENTDDL